MKLFFSLHLHFILRRRHVVLCYVDQLHVRYAGSCLLTRLSVVSCNLQLPECTHNLGAQSVALRAIVMNVIEDAEKRLDTSRRPGGVSRM
jgi:hypothetical protein